MTQETGRSFKTSRRGNGGPIGRRRNGLTRERRRAGGADQPVRLLENEMVLGLLSGKEGEGDKGRAEHQPHQHDPAVGALVGVVE